MQDGESVGSMATVINGGSVKSISSASAVLAAANDNRRSLFVQNLSTTAMLTVVKGQTAVSKAGYNLCPAASATSPGGNVTIDDYTGAVNGIMSGADATSGNVAVVET